MINDIPQPDTPCYGLNVYVPPQTHMMKPYLPSHPEGAGVRRWARRGGLRAWRWFPCDGLSALIKDTPYSSLDTFTHVRCLRPEENPFQPWDSLLSSVQPQTHEIHVSVVHKPPSVQRFVKATPTVDNRPWPHAHTHTRHDSWRKSPSTLLTIPFGGNLRYLEVTCFLAFFPLISLSEIFYFLAALEDETFLLFHQTRTPPASPRLSLSVSRPGFPILPGQRGYSVMQRLVPTMTTLPSYNTFSFSWS